MVPHPIKKRKSYLSISQFILINLISNLPIKCNFYVCDFVLIMTNTVKFVNLYSSCRFYVITVAGYVITDHFIVFLDYIRFLLVQIRRKLILIVNFFNGLYHYYTDVKLLDGVVNAFILFLEHIFLLLRNHHKSMLIVTFWYGLQHCYIGVIIFLFVFLEHIFLLLRIHHRSIFVVGFHMNTNRSIIYSLVYSLLDLNYITVHTKIIRFVYDMLFSNFHYYESKVA